MSGSPSDETTTSHTDPAPTHVGSPPPAGIAMTLLEFENIRNAVRAAASMLAMASHTPSEVDAILDKINALPKIVLAHWDNANQMSLAQGLLQSAINDMDRMHPRLDLPYEGDDPEDTE